MVGGAKNPPAILPSSSSAADIKTPPLNLSEQRGHCITDDLAKAFGRHSAVYPDWLVFASEICRGDPKNTSAGNRQAAVFFFLTGCFTVGRMIFLINFASSPSPSSLGTMRFP